MTKKMKKILLTLFAVIGLLSSCTNDDIEISNLITFKVNPQTVVDNLYEYQTGDLTSLDDNSKLNVTLYIFDNNGILVQKVSNQYAAYTHMMTVDLPLSAGDYTAVATTDVSSSTNFWTFEGTDKLTTFKIKDTEKIGGKNKILGLTVQKINIGNESKTIYINVENAGAVTFVRWTNWNKYNNVKTYLLLGKQACDYITFDTNGNNDYSLRSSNDFDYIKAKYSYDSQYSGARTYFFTFPMKNASFQFFAETTTGGSVKMGPEWLDEIKRGSSYYFLYNFVAGGEDEPHRYDVTPSSNNSRSISLVEKANIGEDKENDHILYDYEGGSIYLSK